MKRVCIVPARTTSVLDWHGQHRPVGELGALVHRDVKPVEVVIVMELETDSVITY